MSKISNGKDAPVLVTEFVKCRSLPNNNGRSPVGSLFIYEDRVVWRDENGSEELTVDFSSIRGQKVSPPNKSKTQLQLCLHEGLGEPATFAFVNPQGGQEGHMKERDLVKDTLQQLLLKYRAVANAEAKKANHQQGLAGGHMQQKERLLNENPRLQMLYRDLVTTNLISPKEFWAEYVGKSNDEATEQKIGVSGGFLSNVKKTDGCNGLKLNLTSDTIQAIFQTYPVVEQKHLELVPHEMTEQEFWRKFFQSHYFHRDRAANVNPTEVFADCLKVDESDMKALTDAGVSSRHFDLDEVYMDIGLASNDDGDLHKKGNANKALLVKRFNYHSGRVLRACLGDDGPSSSTIGSSLPQTSSKTHVPDQPLSVEPPTKRSKLDNTADSQRLVLDSAELANDGDHNVGQPLNIDALTKLSSESDVFPDDLSARLKQKILRSLPLQRDDVGLVIDTRDAERAMLECSPGGSLWQVSSANVLPKAILSQLETLHYALSELLRHFWCCFPPKTPDLESKLERMMETLQKFEATKLTPAVQEIGKHNVDHLLSMLNSAYARFDSYKQRKTGQKQR